MAPAFCAFKVFCAWCFLRLLAGERVALILNAVLGNSPDSGKFPPSAVGHASNPFDFSVVPHTLTVPDVLVSVLWCFYIMGRVKLVLVVLEACVIG